MNKLCVIGAGSWGTALAITLASKGYTVDLWGRNSAQIVEMKKTNENVKYLPGISLGENIFPKKSFGEAISGAEMVLFSVPAQYFREVFTEAQQYLDKDAVIVNVAKGIEQKTLMRMSQVAYEINPSIKYAVLSGPSHAEEVGKKLPTTVAIASNDRETAMYVQDLFFTERFRTYINDDVVGVELGGALKNIIALGAGISDGMGFGDNAKAALMTRGLTEISRLGIAMGAKQETFAGLTGVGDLIVTCTSMHSRNRRCGIMIGEGLSPDDATKKIGMVVEGMFTTEAAYGLAQKNNIEMPITEHIYKVINGEINAKAAVEILMGRERKHEKV
ncbi:MAG: NAD(P)H-dependent glycerol-3-phosphate dehydrogenase [Anaerovoracaceae bacterium]